MQGPIPPALGFCCYVLEVQKATPASTADCHDGLNYHRERVGEVGVAEVELEVVVVAVAAQESSVCWVESAFLRLLAIFSLRLAL